MSSSPAKSSSSGRLETEAQRASSFIDRQLQRATLHVKLIDLAGAFLMWAAMTLALLLTLAVIDAWIFPLGTFVRVFALAVLVFGSLAYLGIYLWPLLTRRINPMYAARMVEEDHPGLKNSLLNFLSFRQTPTATRRRIMQALADRAAGDLSQLSIEAAIDHGKVIKVGYVLIGLLVVCSLYKVLSPKDPVTTLTRIAAPLADVPPPSRVQIAEVEPGDVTWAFGQPLEVTSRIQGLPADQRAEVWITTDDQRWVDHAIPMPQTSDNGQYSATLSTGATGIEQGLTYQVRAGDAQSRRYRVTLKQLPTASIDRIELIPPDYTQLPARDQVAQGDVQGVEGTRVVIQGQANVPLEAAVLEFLRPVTENDPADRTATPAAKRIRMQVSDRSFAGEFRLRLKADRVTPEFTHYRIALLTSDQRVNDDPSLYRIDVLPDMAPEIQWLAPAEDEVEIPVDGELALATRAIDRDFQISRVVLRGDQQGKQVLAEELLDASRTPDSQHLGKYRLRPQELGLAPGSVIVLHAEAFDNRCDPESQLPDPNRAVTANLTVRISPESSRASRPNEGNAGEPNDVSPGGEEGAGADQSGSSGGDQAPGETLPTGQAGGEGDEGEQTGAEGSASNDPSQTGEGNQDQPGAGAAATQSSGADNDQPQSNQAGGDQAGEGGNTGDPSSAPSDPSSGGSAESQSEPSTGPQQTGSGDTSGQPEGQPQTGGAPDQGAAGANDASTGSSDSGGSEDASQTPPEHEGDVFERILKRLQEQEGQDSSGDSAEDSQDAASGNQRESASGESSASQDPTQTPNAGRESNPPSGSDAGANSPNESPTKSAGDSGSAGPEGGSEGAGRQEGSGAGSQSQDSADTSADSGSDNPSGTGRNPGESPAQDGKEPEGQTSGENPSGTPSSAGGDSGDTSGDSGQTSSESDSESNKPAVAGTEGSDQDAGDAGDATGEADSDATGESSENDADSNAAESGGESTAASEAGDENSAGTQSQEGATESAGSSGSETTGTRDAAAAPGTPSERARPGQANDGSFGQASDGSQELPPGEQAKLDYAQRATDLVLDYLQDQQDDPDQDLLRELDWTEQDLRDFLSRWRQMKQAAETGDARQQQRLEQRLRSLGLMPQGTQVERLGTPDDRQRGLQQDGARTAPPPEFAEKFRRFLQGAAQRETRQDR